MPDLKTTQETVRSPILGTDLVRLATSGANWQATLANVFSAAPGSGGGTTNFLRADGTWAAPPGGSPGGANTNVQFNNSGVFGGDSGFTYAGSGQATLALGSITTNNKALNITGTWNASGITFDAPLFMNITNTASAIGSKLLDLQIGGTSQFSLNKFGAAVFVSTDQTRTGYISYAQNELVGVPGFFLWDRGQSSGGSIVGGGSTFTINAPLCLTYSGNDTAWYQLMVLELVNNGGAAGPGVRLASQTALVWANSANFSSSTDDVFLFRDAAGILAQRNGTNAQTFRLYNTFTNASNYEVGIFDWQTNTNVLTLGMQALGTGSNRTIAITTPTPNASVYFIRGATGATANCIIGRDSGTGAEGIVFPNLGSIGWAPGTLPVAGTLMSFTSDTFLSRIAPGVIGATASANQGWLQWGGQTRVTGDVTYTSNTALANVSGLSVTLQAGRTYNFKAYLPITGSAGGFQAAISGTATATDIRYDGYLVDNAAGGTKGAQQASALGTAVANPATITGPASAYIYGTITVNAAGTLTVQAAQATSSATSTVLKRGAFFYVYDVA